MKLSVSAPWPFKNMRHRRLVLWDDRICWHRDEEERPAGELRFEPGITALRDNAGGPTLVITRAGRKLLLKGSAQEVCKPTLPALTMRPGSAAPIHTTDCLCAAR